MADDSQTLAAAKAFENMAARLRHNASEPFAGAFVIIPPGDQTSVALFIVDDACDSTVFWGTVQARIAKALEELEDAARAGGMMAGIPGRR